MNAQHRPFNTTITTARPPLSEALVVSLAQLVDDPQTERRDPAHSELECLISEVDLRHVDPGLQGKPVGKCKRIRAVLSWALGNNVAAGERLAGRLVATVQGHGGFRPESENYCGAEAIANLTSAFASQGWDLGRDGSLQPMVLESLSGRPLTAALRAYADRARRGALDSPLLAGTAKDLLQATAAHVIVQRWGSYSRTLNFPTLLGQAFTAVGLATSHDVANSGELAHRRVEPAA